MNKGKSYSHLKGKPKPKIHWVPIHPHDLEYIYSNIKGIDEKDLTVAEKNIKTILDRYRKEIPHPNI